MSSAPGSAGDAVSSAFKVIEVRVAELRQLFNAIDPSPFRERDLDPRAEEFIVEWARDIPRDAPLTLLVHLERACGPEDEATVLGDAMHGYFKQRALDSQRRLRELFRRGRISLVIALAFLSASVAVSDLVGCVSQSRFVEVFREGLLIFTKGGAIGAVDWRGWRCGARSRCSSTISGPFARTFGSSSA